MGRRVRVEVHRRARGARPWNSCSHVMLLNFRLVLSVPATSVKNPDQNCSGSGLHLPSFFGASAAMGAAEEAEHHRTFLVTSRKAHGIRF